MATKKATIRRSKKGDLPVIKAKIKSLSVKTSYLVELKDFLTDIKSERNKLSFLKHDKRVNTLLYKELFSFLDTCNSEKPEMVKMIDLLDSELIPFYTSSHYFLNRFWTNTKCVR